MKRAATILGPAIIVTSHANPATSGTEDIELRDLNLTGWNCANQQHGTTKTQDGIERDRMRNRWPPAGLPACTALDTAAFIKKGEEHDSRIQGRRRAELTADQKDELALCENQIAGRSWGCVSADDSTGPNNRNCRRTSRRRSAQLFSTIDSILLKVRSAGARLPSADRSVGA